MLQQRYMSCITIIHLLLAGQVLEIPTIINTLLHALNHAKVVFRCDIAGHEYGAGRIFACKQAADHQFKVPRPVARAFGVHEFEPVG